MIPDYFERIEEKPEPGGCFEFILFIALIVSFCIFISTGS